MNARIIFLTGIAILAVQCGNKGNRQGTEPVAANDWVWLFDGSSTDRWRDTKSDQFPEHGWVIRDNLLTVLGETEDHPAGHDIITKEMYSSFELQLEVKLTEGANSGVKYNVTDSFPGKEGSYLGLEYQLIDNEGHPDAVQGREGNHSMAALYDLIPPPGDITINPPGEWNKVGIIMDGSHVEHWLNGEKVLEFDRDSQDFRDLVAISKYKDLENFGELDKGHILLQGHGNTVSFRAIRIRTW